MMRAGFFAAVTTVVTTVLTAGVVRAETTYNLQASLAGGATDNPTGQVRGAAGRDDVFGMVSVGGQGGYEAQRSRYEAGYRFRATLYQENSRADTNAHDAVLRAGWQPTAKLELRLSANLVVTRLSGAAPIDPTSATTEVLPPGVVLFMTTTGSGELVYTPTARRRYLETLSVSRLNVLESPNPLPETTNLRSTTRIEDIRARDTRSFQLELTDSIRSGLGDRGAYFAQGHTFLGLALLGWRRELSDTWSAEVQGGSLGMYNLEAGPFVVGPAGAINIGFRREPWFVTLSLQHRPVPNLFLGQATVNDSVSLRVMVPLSQKESLFLMAYGSFNHARVVAVNRELERAYDAQRGSVSLNYRLRRQPLYFSAEYAVQNQNGAMVGARMVPDLFRQTVLVTVTGMYPGERDERR